MALIYCTWVIILNDDFYNMKFRKIYKVLMPFMNNVYFLEYMKFKKSKATYCIWQVCNTTPTVHRKNICAPFVTLYNYTIVYDTHSLKSDFFFMSWILEMLYKT